MPPAFSDRRDAGRRVAERLADLAGDRSAAGDGDSVSGDGRDGPPGGASEAGIVVLGLPRGGVPVAAEVASALHAPLDVLVVGKVGVPGHEELALAAVAADGQIAANPSVIAAVGLTADEVADLAGRQVRALARRAGELRGGRAPEPLAGRTVVIVDDGMATGATMRVAVDVVRGRSPRSLVAAVPVAAAEAVAALASQVDRMECVLTPPGFRAVGPWYSDFTQVTDDEVRSALHRADDA
ncbi:MAG TPA: phosphoribosyltransferase family protein [Acidimicrobiales bacterium]|nr:phosphoribosyltransferase family protein [Acidimicrobiales bacterium]